MTPEDRILEIDAALSALQPAWPAFSAVLQDKKQALTVELIAQDSEQTRGRIKQLRELMELPDLLRQEREGIRAALAE